MKAARHKWGAPDRPDPNNTFRRCLKCGLTKVTRHEEDNDPRHWVEWRRSSGPRFCQDDTPPCDSTMEEKPMAKDAKKTKAEAPAGSRLIELRASNFMKLKAVRITPDGSVFKVMGDNEQGKSAVLTAVSAAIGGKAFFPPDPVRRGEKEAELLADFGSVKIRRRIWNKEKGGVGHELVVEYADGTKPKYPQQALDELRGSPIADDPLEFARLKPGEQFDLLKKLVPNFDFAANAQKRKGLFEARTLAGRDHDRAKAFVETMDQPADTRRTPIDVTELAAKMREASDHNSKIDAREARREEARSAVEAKRDEADRLIAQARKLNEEANATAKALDDAEELPAKIDVSKLEEQINGAAEINEAVTKAVERDRKVQERDEYEKLYDNLSDQIDALDEAKAKAIAGSKLPVKELSFGEDDEILLDGLPFEQASTARKIRVATSLLMALKPELRVLMVREGSLLDKQSRAALEEAAAENDFLVLMEVVGAEVGGGIVIEDGEVVQ